MAVQKSRKTPSRRGMHRSHDALARPALSTDPQSGETHLRHRITPEDRKSTRLNSSHSQISYAVFCLKKKNKQLIRLYRTLNCINNDFCKLIAFHAYTAQFNVNGINISSNNYRNNHAISTKSMVSNN